MQGPVLQQLNQLMTEACFEASKVQSANSANDLCQEIPGLPSHVLVVKPQDPAGVIVLDYRDLKQVRTLLFQSMQASSAVFNIYSAIQPSPEIESGRLRHRATNLQAESIEYCFVANLFERTFSGASLSAPLSA